jgi:hypothetical protein
VAGQDKGHFSRQEVRQRFNRVMDACQSSPTRFSAQLSEILGRLRVAGITQLQLVTRTIPLGHSEPEFSNTALSLWKHGRANPTLTNLRALVTTLERCRYGVNRPLVTADEIRQLVTAAGFTLDDLAATSILNTTPQRLMPH